MNAVVHTRDTCCPVMITSYTLLCWILMNLRSFFFKYKNTHWQRTIKQKRKILREEKKTPLTDHEGWAHICRYNRGMIHQNTLYTVWLVDNWQNSEIECKIRLRRVLGRPAIWYTWWCWIYFVLFFFNSLRFVFLFCFPFCLFVFHHAMKLHVALFKRYNQKKLSFAFTNEQ